MATKVGEGYIEIKAKLVGFNRDLLRDARQRVREIEGASREASASIAIKPKITGITKGWQREVQAQLDATVTGLTVGVNVKLERKDLKATQDNFVSEATRAGERAGTGLASGFKSGLGNLQAEIDKASSSIRNGFKDSGTGGVWNLAGSLEAEVKNVGSVADSMFPSLGERVGRHGDRAGNQFATSFGKSLRANFFDNVSEGLLGLAAQFVATAVSAQPLLGSLSNLAGGMVSLSTVVVDLYGSFLALPAVWTATAQASGVLAIALWGVQDAIGALETEQQQAAMNAATSARQVAQAQEQIADAKERMRRAVEAANDSVTRSEQALAETTAAAARRISDAQERVYEAQASNAEAVERATERIADAQRALSRAYETAADRIASAESRHADSIRRVKDAQEDLNQAYKDALERFEDLNVALGNSILDEEGARIAIERAKERLDEINADPEATELDKREARHAYEEALQRLQEIQERNADLRKEVEEANRTGVEGSREVTSAKERLLEAQRAEIEAQAAIAQAHKDAAEQIQDAQARLSEAQAEAVKAQLDGAKRVQEAEQALADARLAGAKDVQAAQDNLARTQKDAARTVVDSQRDIARAIANLTEVQGKQNAQWYATQYALSQLSPEAQKFVRFLADVLIPRIQEVQFAIQDAFFPPIQRGLEKSDDLIDLFQAKLALTAGTFGELVARTIEWLNTPEAQNSLGNILDSNNRLFGLLGDAGLHFGDVLLVLAESAGPFLEDMGKLVLEFATWIDDVVTSKEGREELKTFFENVADTVRDVYDITKLVGSTLYEVYKMARPYGQDLLGDIKDIAQRFDDWVNSVEGRTQIEKFLENGERFLKSIFRLIEDVAKAFFEFGASNDLSSLIDSIRLELLPAILNVVDALGGGSEGGGFIFLIKAITIALNTFAGTVSLVAALVSGLGAIFTGDWSGARDSFADFLNTVEANTKSVFGEVLPQQFYDTSKSFSDSVRGMQDDGVNLSSDLGRLGDSTSTWGNTTEVTTTFVETNFDEMSREVKDRLERYAGDVDGKTKDAKGKADLNSKETREAIVKQMEQMRLESEAQMERYRSTVDQKTLEAKGASNRNVGDIVKDASTLLVPFSSIFFRAGEEAQKAIRTPGASWWDVGLAIINGLWDGVKNLIPNFLTSIWNLGVDIVNTIRRALDSRSPSRKMFAVGEDVTDGLAMGIEATAKKVGRASAKLGKTVLDSFGTPQLGVEMGGVGHKIAPAIGAVDPTNLAGVGRIVNIAVHAAPSVPTERQISNVLKYQDALYDND